MKVLAGAGCANSSTCRVAPRELAARLTMAGLEAEKIEEIGADWDMISSRRRRGERTLRTPTGASAGAGVPGAAGARG